MGHKGGLINPRPGRGQYRASFSNTGGSPKPRKRAPCQKRVDLLSYDSKTTEKGEQYDWRAKNIWPGS